MGTGYGWKLTRLMFMAQSEALQSVDEGIKDNSLLHSVTPQEWHALNVQKAKDRNSRRNDCSRSSCHTCSQHYPWWDMDNLTAHTAAPGSHKKFLMANWLEF